MAPTHQHPPIPRFCPVRAPRKCLKLEDRDCSGSADKRPHPRPASYSSPLARHSPFTAAPSPPATHKALVRPGRFEHSKIATNDRVWPKADRPLRRRPAGKADGLLPTQPSRSDLRRRFSKAATRQPSGDVGSGWLSAHPLLNDGCIIAEVAACTALGPSQISSLKPLAAWPGPTVWLPDDAPRNSVSTVAARGPPLNPVCYRLVMPAKHARHIALSGPLAEWAESQVAKGEYSSLSELIRTALRALRAQEETRSALEPASSRGDKRPLSA